MNNHSCIRILADPVQIKECKASLSRIERPLQTATQLFNLAGNEARLKILFLLYKEREMCPCDLSDILQISVGGVSQHLRKLRDGGLIKSKKVGQTVFYSLAMDPTNTLQPILKELSKATNKELVKDEQYHN